MIPYTPPPGEASPRGSAPAPSAAPSGSAAPSQAASPSAAAGGAPCGRPKLVEGRTVTTVASMPKPARGVFFDEPSFHACVARATSHASDGLDTFARNDYSRRQAFNADNTLFLATSRDGAWYLYDVKSLRLVKNLSGVSGDAEPGRRIELLAQMRHVRLSLRHMSDECGLGHAKAG